MSKFNHFSKLTVSTTDFADKFVTWEFISAGIMLLNENSSASDVIQYSFDGETLHGDLTPGTLSAAMSFDNRKESKIYFRLAAGATTAVVRVETWA